MEMQIMIKNTRKIKVIGVGGIGTYLIEPLVRYLNSQDKDIVEVTVIDGDKYEERNRERQRFEQCNNKAEQTVEILRKQFPRIYFKVKAEYLTADNVITNIRENDHVFLCVDNHATRKLVSDRCQELDNVLLISGGNDYTDGNVIIYIRKNGKNITKSPTELYKSIANPEDKNPGESTGVRAGCEAEAQVHPQLLFTNLAIASWMLNCYYAFEQDKVFYEQIYVDILTGRSRPAPEKLNHTM
jgi:molybdopterin/thiamine biosynthesis adenylyltransferase